MSVEDTARSFCGLRGSVYALGTDGNWWRWTGWEWAFVGPYPGGGGTDCQGTWTIGSGFETLRNGVHMGGGYATQLRCVQGTIYAMGTSGSWWWWTGGEWAFFGPDPGAGGSPAPSPPTPPVSGGGECSAIWTIGNGQETLRNGVHAGGGYATELRCVQDTIYARGTSGSWWQWNGGSWAFFGSDPGGSAPPVGGSGGSLRYAVFTPSFDHSTNVDAYYLEIVLLGSEPFTMVQGSIGKPGVVGGECRVDVSALLNQIPQGRFTEFVAVITAYNSYGSSGAAVSAPFIW